MADESATSGPTTGMAPSTLQYSESGLSSGTPEEIADLIDRVHAMRKGGKHPLQQALHRPEIADWTSATSGQTVVSFVSAGTSRASRHTPPRSPRPSPATPAPARPAASRDGSAGAKTVIKTTQKRSPVRSEQSLSTSQLRRILASAKAAISRRNSPAPSNAGTQQTRVRSLSKSSGSPTRSGRPPMPAASAGSAGRDGTPGSEQGLPSSERHDSSGYAHKRKAFGDLENHLTERSRKRTPHN